MLLVDADMGERISKEKTGPRWSQHTHYTLPLTPQASPSHMPGPGWSSSRGSCSPNSPQMEKTGCHQAVKETQENSDCPSGVAATGQDVAEHTETTLWIEPVLSAVCEHSEQEIFWKFLKGACD